jgi:hypothetical protein
VRIYGCKWGVLDENRKAYSIDVVLDYVRPYNFGDGIYIPYGRDVVFECSGCMIPTKVSLASVSVERRYTRAIYHPPPTLVDT